MEISYFEKFRIISVDNVTVLHFECVGLCHLPIYVYRHSWQQQQQHMARARDVEYSGD